MDFRLQTDHVMCVSGPSQSGKTEFVLKLLEQKHEMFCNPMERKIYGVMGYMMQHHILHNVK